MKTCKPRMFSCLSCMLWCVSTCPPEASYAQRVMGAGASWEPGAGVWSQEAVTGAVLSHAISNLSQALPSAVQSCLGAGPP